MRSLFQNEESRVTLGFQACLELNRSDPRSRTTETPALRPAFAHGRDSGEVGGIAGRHAGTGAGGHARPGAEPAGRRVERGEREELAQAGQAALRSVQNVPPGFADTEVYKQAVRGFRHNLQGPC
jgi:hypothetical protein